MIISELSGGLGNQLFEYAAAHSLARRHGTTIAMNLFAYTQDKLRQYLLDAYALPQNFASEGEINALRGNRLFASGRLRRLLPLPANPHLYIEPHFHYDAAFEQLGDEVYLRGYFQSERYFADYADEVRKLFTLQQLPESAMSSQIQQAEMPVSLHVRRGDYVAIQAVLAQHGTASTDYYERAIAIIRALYPKASFFVFSDDIPWVREHMGFIPAPVFVEGDTQRPQTDLHLMSLCQHHITANSTFSWWGAWLNGKPGKQVIAPRQWFAQDRMRAMNTVDIYPAGWILL